MRLKMKIKYLFIATMFSCCLANAQESMAIKPFSSISTLTGYERFLPEEYIPAPDLSGIKEEDIERDNRGQFYRIAKHIATDINLKNSGIWSVLPNGDKVWRIQLTS